jgi:hypothetical protein
MTMPPLPEPDIEDYDYELWGQNAKADAWFEAKVLAYGEACREEGAKAERERCARKRCLHRLTADICGNTLTPLQHEAQQPTGEQHGIRQANHPSR